MSLIPLFSIPCISRLLPSSPMKPLTSLLLALLFLSSQTVLSFKRDEFRNCNQTPFCKRARSRSPGGCTLTPHNISISNGELTATLFSEHEDQIRPLILSLSVYHDGILRLKIDEDYDHSDPPCPKTRFQVPDVITPEFDSNKLWLQRLSTETLNDESSPSTVVYLSDGYDAILRHDPFEIYVRDKQSGNQKLISLNSHQLFDFEQLRVKEEGEEDGENWEERFRGHTDTRPYGPQSISFDVSFYSAEFVSGIPERAMSLALKPTRGPGVEKDVEPYRLFNLDVF